MAEIENLSISISASADGAISKINSLASSLNGLKRTAKLDSKPITAPIDDVAEGAEKAERSTRSFGERLKAVASSSISVSLKMKSLSISTKSVGNAMKRIASATKSVGKAFMALPKHFGGKLISSIKASTDKLNQFFASIKRIAMYRMIRTAMKEIAQGFSDGIKNLYGWSSAVNGHFAASMDRLATSAQYLKNSIGAMASPLIEAVAPAIDFIIDKFVDLFNIVNQLFARITGRSTYTAAKKVAATWGDAAKSASGSAKKAVDELKRTILGFDEINKLNDNKTSSGGGGGSAGGTDYSNMFETRSISGTVSTFADQLKAAFEAANWQGLGVLLGDKLNSIVDAVPWNHIGSTIGEKITNLFEAINGFTTTFRFQNVGKAISDGLNGLVDRLNFDTLGEGLSRLMTAKLVVLASTASNFKWSEFGAKLASGFNKFIGTMDEVISGISWEDMARKMVRGLNNFISHIEWRELGESIGRRFNSALSTLKTAVTTFKWGEAGKDFAKIVNGLIGEIDPEELAATFEETIKGVIDWATMFVKQFDAENFALKIREALKDVPWGDIAKDIWNFLVEAFGKLGNLVEALFTGKTAGDSNLGLGIASGVGAIAGIKGIKSLIGNLIGGSATGAASGTGASLGTGLATSVGTGLLGSVAPVLGIAATGYLGYKTGTKIYDDYLKENLDTILQEINDKYGYKIADFVGNHDLSNKEWKGTGNGWIDGLTWLIGGNSAMDRLENSDIYNRANDRRAQGIATAYNNASDNQRQVWRDRAQFIAGGGDIAGWDRIFEESEFQSAWREIWNGEDLTISASVDFLPAGNGQSRFKNKGLLKYLSQIFAPGTDAQTRVELIKEGWKDLKTYVGANKPLSASIALTKTGWSTLANYIGTTNPLSAIINLAKGNYSTLNDFVGANNPITAFVNLAKQATGQTIQTLFGDRYDAFVTVKKAAPEQTNKQLFGGDYSVFATLQKAVSTATNKLLFGGDFTSYANLEKKNALDSTAGLFGVVFTAKAMLEKYNTAQTLVSLFGEWFNAKANLTKYNNGQTLTGLFGEWFNAKANLTKYNNGQTLTGLFGEWFNAKANLTKYNNGQTLTGLFGEWFNAKANLTKYYTNQTLPWLFGDWFNAKANLTKYYSNQDTASLFGTKFTAYVSLVANGISFANNVITAIGKALGFASGGYVNANGSFGKFAAGGAINARGKIQAFAGGTSGVHHGTMFMAGEAGPEIVGHVGGRTEVLNKSQLAATMYAAVQAAMAPASANFANAAAYMYQGARGYGEEDMEALMELVRAGSEATQRQNDLLRQQNEYLRQINDKEFTAEWSTSGLAKAQQRTNRRAGVTVIPVGT